MKATTTITIEVKGTTLALTRDEARQLLQALQAEIGALPHRQQLDPLVGLDPSEFFRKLKEQERKKEETRKVFMTGGAISQNLAIPQ